MIFSLLNRSFLVLSVYLVITLSLHQPLFQLLDLLRKLAALFSRVSQQLS